MKILIIFYDNHCPNCTRFTKLIQKLDWLKLIKIKQLRNELVSNSFRDIDLELAEQQMASFGTKWHYGFNSIYFIFARIPVCWVFLPLFYLLKVTGLGQYLYIQLAIKRTIIPIHCNTMTCEI
jgi:predicted DCC family thiol-disulfide oxidoreductase YuxK